MRRGLCAVVLCILVCAQGMRGQTPNDAVAALQRSLGSSQLVLRNFSGENKVVATWNGTQSDLAPALWHTMGVMQLKSAKLSGHTLTLQCVRQVLIKNAQDQLKLYPEPTNVQIVVDLGDADPAAVLPKIQGDLFFASTKDAVDAIPGEWKSATPARMDKSPWPEKVALPNSKPLCDCAEKDSPVCKADKMQRQGITPPKALKVKDPQFPDTAKGFFEAHVLVGLKVNESGHPEDVWVLRPAGKGLDEAAAQTVLDYVFRPAMCHDSPVSVVLNIVVGFQRD